MCARVFGEQHGHAPRPRRGAGARVQRVVGRLALAFCRQRGELPLEARIDDVRPLALDADQRGARGLAERVVRVLPAASSRLLDLRVIRLLARRAVDVGESNPEPAVAREQHRQVRWIDLRQLPQDVDQSAQSARDGQVHAFPDDGLGLRARFRISAIVQDLHQPDLRGIEPLDHVQRVIVAALVHFVTLEGRANEDRQHQLAMLPGELRQREHRAGAGSLAAGADQHDDGVLLQQGLDLAVRFLQRLSGNLGVVPRSEPARRPSADEQAFLGRHVGQRELVRIEEAGRQRLAQARRVPAVGLLRDREVSFEQRLDRSENVATAASRAEEKERHLPPASRMSALSWKGTTTQRPRAYGRPLTNACSRSTACTRATS